MNNPTNVTPISHAQDQRLVQNLYDLLNGYGQSVDIVLNYLSSDDANNPLHLLEDSIVITILAERRELQERLDDANELMEKLEVGAISQAVLIAEICPEVQLKVQGFMVDYADELNEAYEHFGYEIEVEDTDTVH